MSKACKHKWRRSFWPTTMITGIRAYRCAKCRKLKLR
jgi:hypothetical protein